MNWEIRDMGRDLGITGAHIDKDANQLHWDFALGSPFDLCAVFPWDGKMTLEDYQKKGQRPYLYHRRSKTCRSTAYEGSLYGYALYPVILEENKRLFYIGSRGCHAVFHQKVKRRSIFAKCLQKRFFFRPYVVGSFKLEMGREKLYYRISKGQKIMDTVYEADTNRDIYIYLEKDEDALFFDDHSCTRQIFSTG